MMNWPEVSVREICEDIVDCVNKTAPRVDYPTPFKMIRTTNVRDGWVDTESVGYVTEEVYRTWTRRGAPKPGDVLLTREAPLGEVGLLRSSDSVFLGQRLVMYRADNSKLDNRFLLYSMLDQFVQGQIKSLGSGATVEHMRVPDCERLRIRLPDRGTQTTIANILSGYDELIENNTRRVRILEEMAQAIYREWFVEFRYPDHQDVPLVDSDLGPIPEGWGAAVLDDLVEEMRRGVDPTTIPPQTPYIGLEHMPERSIAISEWGCAADAGSRKYRYERGEILFGKIRPYFHKVGVPPVDGICSTDAIVLRPRMDEVAGLALAIVSSVDFVGHAVQTSNGTKMPRANWSVLEKWPVAMPPGEILSQFAGFMDATIGLIHHLVLSNRNLRLTRDLLLPRLISGEIDVSGLEAPEVA